MDIVESVTRITEPFKKANRKFHPDDSIIQIADGVAMGGGHFQFIAGPCSVGSPEQVMCIADAVKKSGAHLLRGGAFKPRTSPYDFQGLHDEGIKILLEAKRRTGMPIVTEIMNANHLPLFEDVDVIQVGARNMQNFELLKELGHTKKVILLKRGLANTIKELLMSAEYIMAGGNENIILCERGIRTFFSRKFDTCGRKNQRSETRLIIHSHMHTFSTFVNFPVEKLAVYARGGVHCFDTIRADFRYPTTFSGRQLQKSPG